MSETEAETCPLCQRDTFVKPEGSKKRCENCRLVENPTYGNPELADYDLSYRQGRRILRIVGERPGTPGDVGTQLRQIADPDEFNDLLADIRGEPPYYARADDAQEGE